ncbi:hypothetical protein FBUS_02728 [Fasciolopsis buskii]|uniref:EGF-like domain-containing protein n=1 Tax=Fasciolopsis buskii TaxID=27845 RepID=A0A8E0RK91_9TREM|nr:hypothetical protein FBUS_02728 [Fasciolopsis buski]
MAKSVRDWNSLTVILLWLGLYTVSLADDKTSAVLTDQLDPLRRTNRAENTSTVSARPITHTETNSNSPLFFSQYSPPSMKHIPVVSMSLHSEENKHISHPSSVGFDELFPVCKNPCLNGGVCRETSQKLLKCICPADYKGEQCEISSQAPLVFCDESTCQNGGVCTGTSKQPACSCPPDILGRICERRVRSYEVNLLVTNKSKPMDWNVSLANPLSSAYKNISTQVMKTMDAAGKLGEDIDLVSSYYGSEFLGFGNGSLVARVKVKFDLSDLEARKYTEVMIRHHLVSGGLVILSSEKAHSYQLPTDFGVQNSSNFVLKAINPCLTGNNDCSINAQCAVIAPGVYTCTCKAFTIDSSMNRGYPGRRCVYDGLIIFTFILVGSLVSMLIFLLCGCRRTIWYRYKNRGHPEHLTLVNMPSNYDI